jgi:hypothetical protein
MRNLGLGALAAVGALAFAAQANAALLTANLEDFTNGGGFFGKVTLEDTAPNTISITLDVADPINPGLTEADILGVWFDVDDESVLASLQTAYTNDTLFQNIVPAGTIQAALFSANGVNSVGGANNNLNGGGGAGEDFDIGIAVGTQGGPGGFNQTITFDMVLTGLDTSLFLDQRVGMRVQSIDVPGFGGSSKLLGDAGGNGTTPVPEPATLALLGAGVIGLGILRRRRQAA